jgi:hypothetical protein
MVWNCVWSCWFQLGNMEDRVNCPHAVGKSEGKGMGSDLGYNFVGAQILFRESLRGSG